MLSTWAINGTFTERAIGSVFIMQQDNCRFLSMREEWGGLYIYGEYEPDKYFMPEKPILFLPREIEPDKPVTAEVTVKVFAMPGGKGRFPRNRAGKARCYHCVNERGRHYPE